MNEIKITCVIAYHVLPDLGLVMRAGDVKYVGELAGLASADLQHGKRVGAVTTATVTRSQQVVPPPPPPRQILAPRKSLPSSPAVVRQAPPPKQAPTPPPESNVVEEAPAPESNVVEISRTSRRSAKS